MQGTATLVLESPFYGSRMPAVQTGSRLQRVSDLLTLGRATIEEGLFLLDKASQEGIPRLGELCLLQARYSSLGLPFCIGADLGLPSDHMQIDCGTLGFGSAHWRMLHCLARPAAALAQHALTLTTSATLCQARPWRDPRGFSMGGARRSTIASLACCCLLSAEREQHPNPRP